MMLSTVLKVFPQVDALTGAVLGLRRQLPVVTALLALLLTAAAQAAPQSAPRVKDARVWNQPNKVQVVFDLSAPVAHTVFELPNPRRVVVDLDGAAGADVLRKLKLRSPLLGAMRSAPQADGRLRIVLDVNRNVEPKSYLMAPSGKYGHRLVLDLWPEAAPAAAAAQTKTAAAEAILAGNPTATVPTSKPTPVVTAGTSVTGRDIVVAIDAGHGGKDSGAVGMNGTREKDVVLQIARRLYNVLKVEKGIKPVLVRDGDYFLPLAERREKARREFNADLFVSIHADAFTKRSAKGASVFALSRHGATSTLARVLAERENQADAIGGLKIENADEMITSVMYDLAMEGSMEHSIKVGSAVLQEMGSVTPLHKSRLEQAGFAVLKSPDIPSILVETGFISNPTEERNLKTVSHQVKLSRAMARGIITYFDRHPPPGTLYAQQREGRTVAAASRPAASVDARRHRIANGETLSEIAQRYQVKLSTLLRYNALSSNDVIRPGQVLRIPNS